MLVSIIIPCFNSSEFLRAALDSVLAQTCKDWECIVIDDCSMDNTRAIGEEYARSDSRFVVLTTRENSGSPAVPRNLGIDYARGKFIAFLDSDDQWEESKLENQLDHCEAASSVWCCTSFNTVSDSGVIKVVRVLPEAGLTELKRLNHICLSSVLISRELISSFKFRVVGHEDYDLWLRLSKHGYSVTGLRSVHVSHLRRSGSISSNKMRVLPFYWRIGRDTLGYSFIRCVGFMIRYGVNRLLKGRSE